MTGHFRKRGSRWYVWMDVGPGPDGRRRQKSMGGFATRREAEAAFAEVRDQLRSGTYAPASSLTLGEYLMDHWLPAVRASLRPTGWVVQRTNIANHVVPALGSVQLQKLTPAKLHAFYADLLAHGRRDGRGGLSAHTVHGIHLMLRTALRDAMRFGYLGHNPAAEATGPSFARPEMCVWSPAQLGAFLAQVQHDRLYAAWLLFVTTGMRRGEVVGLRWADVDLPARRLSVTQAVVVAHGALVVSEPKTPASRRTIALDPATVSALGEHRRAQEAEREAAGSAWQDSGLVFTWPDGRVIRPDRFNVWFARHRRLAGLPKLRVHDLRHSHATTALAAGVPAKVVSERLGHANVAVTLDVYSHVLPSLQDEAAAKVARLILGDDATADPPDEADTTADPGEDDQ
ncbi:MAG TPA: site-specific integrase [Acidimicrobiales bacterium]|nr:site-specific integrase [Acidimicrobiales bacterium]